MNTPAKRKWNWMLLLRLLGIALFIFILFRLDMQQVWKNLRQVHIGFFLLALLFQLIMLFIKGMRWQILRTGGLREAGFMRNLGSFLESYAIGVFTPGRLGEFTRAGHEDTKQNRWKSLLRVMAERGFDLGIFIFIAGLASMLYTMIELAWLIKLLVCIGGVVLIIFSFLLLRGNRVKSFLAGLFGENSKVSKLIMLDFKLSLKQAGNVFFLSLMSNAATFFSCFLLALAVGLGTSFFHTSGVVAVAGLLNLLPISIMGLGTREVSLLFLFGELNPERVMSFSFMMFFTLQVSGGILSLVLGQIIMSLKIKNR